MDLYKQARQDYKQLEVFVKWANQSKNKHLMTLENMCSFIGGYILCDELFDVNYGCICATILQNDDGTFELSNSIEIWDDKQCCCLEQSYIVE